MVAPGDDIDSVHVTVSHFSAIDTLAPPTDVMKTREILFRRVTDVRFISGKPETEIPKKKLE